MITSIKTEEIVSHKEEIVVIRLTSGEARLLREFLGKQPWISSDPRYRKTLEELYNALALI